MRAIAAYVFTRPEWSSRRTAKRKRMEVAAYSGRCSRQDARIASFPASINMTRFLDFSGKKISFS